MGLLYARMLSAVILMVTRQLKTACCVLGTLGRMHVRVTQEDPWCASPSSPPHMTSCVVLYPGGWVVVRRGTPGSTQRWPSLNNGLTVLCTRNNKLTLVLDHPIQML